MSCRHVRGPKLRLAEQHMACKHARTANRPPTMEEMIKQSIAQKEATLGMSLDDDEKEKVAAKIRAAYPGIK